MFRARFYSFLLLLLTSTSVLLSAELTLVNPIQKIQAKFFADKWFTVPQIIDLVQEEYLTEAHTYLLLKHIAMVTCDTLCSLNSIYSQSPCK